jgi:hypothetical protein
MLPFPQDTVSNFAVPAQYTPQRVPHFNGNPLIEALPPPLDEDDLIGAVRHMPKFDPEQRSWSNVERRQMLMQLQNILVPLPRHIRLAEDLDALMRQGYVGRAPRTKESNRIFEKLYAQHKGGEKFTASAVPLTAQLSSSLVGLPGVGKTTAIRHILARYPQVIHHEALGLYQVPWLHIETPHDGASTKGLAASIFREIDQLLPDADTGAMFWKPSHSAETLLNNAARVLHMFSVGLLIVDEIQNMTNAPRNHQALMSMLVSASNELSVPILFVGTNKSQRILARDFRQARRSTGIAAFYWGALERGSDGAIGEWEHFLGQLWHFQWTKEPIALNESLSNLMYFHTQGVPDLAIKLFAGAQARAIFDGSEKLTGELLDDVAQREMALVKPMVEALRRDDLEALMTYEDITPISFDGMLKSIGASFSGRTIAGAVVTGSSPRFKPMVSDALTGLGFDQETAASLADEVATGSANAIDGVKKALESSAKGRAVKDTKRPMDALISYPPGDYRNALNPMTEGNTALDRLKALGLVSDIERLLDV